MKEIESIIKCEGLGDREDFFKAMTIFIMDNVERGMDMRSMLADLCESIDMSSEEKAEESRIMLLTCDKITSFFLGEIDEDELSAELANILFAQLTKIEKPINEEGEKDIMLLCRKSLPLVKWEVFPGGSSRNAMEFINAAIKLAKDEGMTLREFLESRGHYDKIIISIYKNSDAFSSEVWRWIIKFFTTEFFKSVYIDALKEAGGISAAIAISQKEKARKENEKESEREKLIVAGKYIAIVTAMQAFGGMTRSDKIDLDILSVQLNDLNKLAVRA